MEWNLDRVEATVSGAGMVTSVAPPVVTVADGTRYEIGPPPVKPNPEIVNPLVNAAVTHAGGVAAKAVGKIGAGLTVMLMVDSLEKPDKKSQYGYECREPDSEDVSDLENAVAEGFAKKFPDANVPWWLGMVLAGSNLYIGTRRSRRKRVASVDGAAPVEEEEERTAPTASALMSMPPIRKTDEQ